MRDRKPGSQNRAPSRIKRDQFIRRRLAEARIAAAS
jgi:hypothetical protein